INIDLLLDAIHKSLPNLIKMTLQIPISNEAQTFISQLYKNARIIDINYDKEITIHLECNIKIKEKIVATCEDLQGIVV
ncbi:MAG: hypothetical protein KAI20_03555, partial [Thermoplasmatales archaeon]|nr:hypothetical protein [Thermoplasmatales archaeon]